jgi:transcriptional regulator with XRE-family HTH domain
VSSNVATLIPTSDGPVGQRIAQARGYRRWSQEQLLAAVARIDLEATPTRRTLGKWENGRTCPTVDDLVLIARATGFGIAWFVDGLDTGAAGPDDGPGRSQYPPWDSNPEPAGNPFCQVIDLARAA